MRIYGPAATLFTRIATSDHKIGDVSIKKGTRVNIGIPEVHYNEKFFENPF
jgi:cytochrome P450